MAVTRVQSAAQKNRELPAPKSQETQPQSIQLRRSARREPNPAGNRGRKSPTRPVETSHTQPTETPSIQSVKTPSTQPVKASPTRPVEPTSTPPVKNTSGERRGDSGAAEQVTDPISFWVKEARWPQELSHPKKRLRPNLAMDYLLARKKTKSQLSLDRKRTDSPPPTTPSNERPREWKNAPYRNRRYLELLAAKNSYAKKCPLDITDESKRLCQALLDNAQPVPKESLFDDDIFERSCEKLQNKNEARVIQDISRLIVPSAEQLSARSQHLERLAESVNEGWNNSIPLTGTRPQPDYSVGFRRDAFTNEQLAKLSPFLGDYIAGDQSFFMGTY